MALRYTFKELLHVSEDALVQHMVKIKDEEGTIVIESNDDHQKASKTEQYIVREKILSASKKARESPSLDTNQLSRRLAEVAEAFDTSSTIEPTLEQPEYVQQPTESPPPPFATKQDKEVRSFVDLSRLGGRPACSLEELENIREDPQKYQQMLEPWQSVVKATLSSDPEVKLFSEQLSRWILFLVWQYQSRGLAPPPELSSFRELRRLNQPLLVAESDSPWINMVHEEYHARVVAKCIEVEKQNHARGLLEYVHETKSRLERYDVHRPFLLHAHPRRQTTLVTWLEYIAFEIWQLDRHIDMCSSHGIKLENASESGQITPDLMPDRSHDRPNIADQTRQASSQEDDIKKHPAFQVALQQMVHNGTERSERIVNWALDELQRVDAPDTDTDDQDEEEDDDADDEIYVAQLRKPSPLLKRKRECENDIEPITPAASFRVTRRVEERKRRRTDLGDSKTACPSMAAGQVQGLSPVTSPTSIDDNHEDNK